MAEPPAFVPRSWLVQPEDFGVEADGEWHLADSLDGAVQLARAVEQHRLAIEMHRGLRWGRNSVADLARALHQRRETLAAKLNGHSPAGPGDLVIWSWMVKGRTIRVPPVRELIASAEDGASPVPSFPLPRARTMGRGRSRL